MFRLALVSLTCLALTACLEKDEDDDDDDDDDTGALNDGGAGGQDSDGDGLLDDQEAGLGTDPTLPDTDGDGLDDGDELDQGTSPTNAYSHPYAGGYNVGACDELPTATDPSGPYNDYVDTWDEGDVAANFTLPDQHGEMVDLYSFCGHNVMIAFGASWCGPCQQLAAETQDLQDTYGPEGFQALEVLIEDVSGQPPDQGDLEDWAHDFDLETVPVLGDGDYAVWPWYERDWGIPTVVHIGPDMTILSVDEYIYDPGTFLD